MPNRTQEQANKSRLEDLEVMKQKACYPSLQIRTHIKGRNKRRFVADCERHEMRASEMLNEIITYYYNHHPEAL